MTGGVNGGGACAVCKHQRRRCEPNCELAAYFPANRMNDFRTLHLVFGVANLTKLIKANATVAARRRAAETLTWEARWRERDPSEGCYREVSCLRRENAVLRAENAALRRRADQCACCCGGGATTLQQQQLLLQVSANNNGGGGRPPGSVLHGDSNGFTPAGGFVGSCYSGNAGGGGGGRPPGSVLHGDSNGFTPAGGFVGSCYSGNAGGGGRGADGNNSAMAHVTSATAPQTMIGYSQCDRRYQATMSNGGNAAAAVPRSGVVLQVDARDKNNTR